MKNAFGRLHVLFIILALLVALGPAAAQEEGTTEALDLSNEPIVLEFSSSAAGPPTFESLADGRVVFKIPAAGSVSGAFEGTLSGAVTQLNAHPMSTFDPISITFTIETDQGTLEGYYAGTYYRPAEDAGFANVNGHGRILSVSGAYADLFLADVIVASQVEIVDGQGVGESGTITITVR